MESSGCNTLLEIDTLLQAAGTLFPCFTVKEQASQRIPKGALYSRSYQ